MIKANHCKRTQKVTGRKIWGATSCKSPWFLTILKMDLSLVGRTEFSIVVASSKFTEYSIEFKFFLSNTK